MVQQSPIRPDPMTLRDALRGLRHAMRRGGESLFDLPVGVLPRPAAQIAGVVLKGGERLARGADRLASGLARRVLEPAPSPGAAEGAGLGGALGGADLAGAAPVGAGRSQAETRAASDRFATACYVAMTEALAQLGVQHALVLESAARSAYLRLAPQIGALAEPQLAAELMLAMLAARVIHDGDPPPDLSPAAIAPLAVFAVLLWLMSSRPEDEDRAALAAAVDLARAIAPDVLAAATMQDALRLGSLFAEFIDHV